MSLGTAIGIVTLLVAVGALIYETRRAAEATRQREAERIRGAAQMLAQGARLQVVRLNNGEALLSAPRYLFEALRARLPADVKTVADLQAVLVLSPWLVDVVTAEGWMSSPLTKLVVDEMRALKDPAREMAGGLTFASVATQRLSLLAIGTGEAKATPEEGRDVIDPWNPPMSKLPWLLKAQLDFDSDIGGSPLLKTYEPSTAVDDRLFLELELEMCGNAAAAFGVRTTQVVERVAALLSETARRLDRVEAKTIVDIARGMPPAKGGGSARDGMAGCVPILRKNGEDRLADLVKETVLELDAIYRGDRDLPLGDPDASAAGDEPEPVAG